MKHPKSYPPPQFTWRNDSLTLHDARRGSLSAEIVPDQLEPGLYRLRLPNGRMTQEPLSRPDAARAATAALRGILRGAALSTTGY